MPKLLIETISDFSFVTGRLSLDDKKFARFSFSLVFSAEGSQKLCMHKFNIRVSRFLSSLRQDKISDSTLMGGEGVPFLLPTSFLISDNISAFISLICFVIKSLKSPNLLSRTLNLD